MSVDVARASLQKFLSELPDDWSESRGHPRPPGLRSSAEGVSPGSVISPLPEGDCGRLIPHPLFQVSLGRHTRIAAMQTIPWLCQPLS